MEAKKPFYRRERFWIFTGLIAALCVVVCLWLAGDSYVKAASPSHQLLSAAEGLDEIAITAAYDPAAQTVSAQQTIDFTNRTDQALSSVMLRTWANAFETEDTSPVAIETLYDQAYVNGFSEGRIVFSAVTVNGQEAGYAYANQDNTAMEITLSSPLQAGEKVTIGLSYVIYVPNAAGRFGYVNGTCTLGNAFPALAEWADGQWGTETYYPIGDPFVSACANYSVTLSLPSGYKVAASAEGASVTAGAAKTITYTAPAVRDFALSISNEWKTAQERAGETVITVYAATKARAREAAKYAKRALLCYGELYGTYPYPTFTVVSADMPFSGAEYPALALVQKSVMDAGGQTLEWVIAHEAAHQWFYAVVGSDQYDQPWQDEALCEYALLDYVQRYYGASGREEMYFQRIETAMRITVTTGITPGSPIEYFGSLSEYSTVVYRRGAALLCALRTALGEADMTRFLKTYYETYAFKSATRQDFEDTLFAVTGKDYSQLIVDYLDTYLNN